MIRISMYNDVIIEELYLQKFVAVSEDIENDGGVRDAAGDSEGGDGELGLVESGSRDRYTASDWSALSRPRRRRQAGGRSRRQGLGLLPTEEENGELLTLYLQGPSYGCSLYLLSGILFTPHITFITRSFR